MKTDIWMPIVIGDYIKDTCHLEIQEHGFYFLTLLHLWNAGGYLTKEKLRKILKISPKKFEKLFEKISEFIAWKGDEFFQKKLLAELEKSNKNRESKRKSGKLGGPRKTKTKPIGKPKGNQEVNQKVNQNETPSPSPSPISTLKSTCKPPNPLKEAVCTYFHLEPATQAEWRRVQRVVNTLKAKEATPEQIKRIGGLYQAEWPDVSLTPEALVKHWDRFKAKAASAKQAEKRSNEALEKIRHHEKNFKPMTPQERREFRDSWEREKMKVLRLKRNANPDPLSAEERQNVREMKTLQQQRKEKAYV